MGSEDKLTDNMIWADESYEKATDFATILNRAASLHAERIYLQPIEPDIAPITFEALQKFAQGFEIFLSQNGVCEGDSCAVISHNSTLLVLQFLASLATGRTFVPINPNSSVNEINFILEDSKPKALIYSGSLEEKVDSIHDWCRLIEISSDAQFIERIFDLGRSTSEMSASPTSESIGELVYTSGTTGRPKGVQLTHRNLVTDVFGLGQIFDFDASDVFLTVAPLFHNSGQILTTLAPLLCGGSTTAIRSDMGFINFWHYVDQFKPTWTLVMPAHVALMLERAAPPAHRGLKGILCGGAPLPKDTQLAFEEKFSAPLYPNYGLTESTSVATCVRPDDHARLSGTAGKPLDINEVRIFHKDQEVPTGVVGEVRIRGNNVCPGYLNLPKLTAEKIRRGWLHTGDLGYLDDDGALQLIDRVDNMIIVGGENVYPTDVERLVPELDSMQEGILLSLPDRIMGRELVLVYRSSESDSKTKDWRNQLLSKLTNFKVPRRFVNVSNLGFKEFPKAANGKVQRAEMQRRLEEVFGFADTTQTARDDAEGDFVADKTKSLVKEIMQIDQIRPDLGMENTPSWDSLNHLQLVMSLEQIFGVTFSATQIAEMTSLDAVIRETTKLKNRDILPD